jgi:FkbM family methyltransferase
MLSNRFWRKMAVNILPEFLKSPLRKRLHGFGPSHHPYVLQYKDGEHLSVHISDNNEINIELIISQDFKTSLEYQLADNADCIEETRSFLKLAKDKRLLFDAGAYTGLFSLLFCAVNQENRVVSFEPSPTMAPIITELSQRNNLGSRIQVQNLAIGDTVGIVSFASEETGFVQVCSSNINTPKIDVKVTTIDEQCQALNLVPDLLKIDVEGFELEALQGASKLLANHRPIILMEIHLNYLEERGIEAKQITDLLENANYKFWSCSEKPITARTIYDTIKPVLRFIAK